MCHDQDAAPARYADRDKTALLERMLRVGVRSRKGILQRCERLPEVDAVLSAVAARLGGISFDDHASSIAEGTSLPKVCPTPQISGGAARSVCYSRAPSAALFGVTLSKRRALRHARRAPCSDRSAFSTDR